MAYCPPGCKYGKRDGFEAGECDPATGEKSLTLVLKKGDTNTCPPTKEVRRPCRARANKNIKNMAGGKTLLVVSGSLVQPMNDVLDLEPSCRYELDEELSEDCDPATGMKTLQMTLVDGNPELCPTTKTTTRRCDREGKGRRKNKGRKGAGKKGKGRARQEEGERCQLRPRNAVCIDVNSSCRVQIPTREGHRGAGRYWL
jgi:hypothetical protein